jgi:alkyl sulfatase BDS1-like metallo-beta-lactamase superfamily hydrolase
MAFMRKKFFLLGAVSLFLSVCALAGNAAEVFSSKPPTEGEWFNRGYYGALSFNVKAVYQKYLGWFDSNAATLWKLPEKISAARWAKYLPRSGGDLVKAAKLAYDDGEYRWAVEVLENVRSASAEWFGNNSAGYEEA